MSLEVVGRDEELSSLSALIDQRVVEHGPFAIALDGDAGIGKSTVWLAAVGLARERGLRVLTTRPAESERELAHTGLGDLFDGVLADVLPALPVPRRRALEVALLVEDAADQPVDARALGVAVRTTLELLADEGLVIAIDDLQWLDASSANALGFALRRLPESNVLLIWTRRLGDGDSPSAVERALDPDRVRRIRVGPLSLGAIQEIVRTGLSDTVPPRRTLRKLHEVSGGNPFYALELARALRSEGSLRDPTQPLPVPERLEELVSARLDGFTGATREALVLASAHARLTRAQLRAMGIELDALAPASDEGVIELADDGVRFTHPLLASVLYQGLPVGERQRAHRRLAALGDDPVARARHLALSADTPDAELADALERAAAATVAQGAPTAAGELGEHALRLTPADCRLDLDRRAHSAARAHLAAGEVERARSLVAQLLSRASPGAERAEALVLMADLESEGLQRTISLLKEALIEPGVALALQASIHQRLSMSVRLSEGLAVAEAHARVALELSDQLGDEALRAAAMGALALNRFNAMKTDALQLAEAAHELASGTPASRVAADAGFALAHVLVWSVRVERARALLQRLHREWSERDERITATALWYSALVELRAGDLALADEYAMLARDLSVQYANEEGESPQNLLPLTLVAAQRGDLERARELAEECSRLAETHDARVSAPTAALAVVELWSGDTEAAVERFAAAERMAGTPDLAEPGMCWWRADQIEALLELGRLDDAVARLDAWEADARRLGREWVLAQATRCRGLVAAARGDVDQARSLLAEAHLQHEARGDPFGSARALLALGVVRRRARQKRGAREAIEAARAGFAEIGAAGWAERAGDELGRIGGRTREEGLTQAERRVADLVAEGRTNAEVASTLFLAERTVASHLTRVYAKLGVRSRTELARKLR